MNYQVPKGTRDILKEEAVIFDTLENFMKGKASSYGYQMIRVPVFEHSELFVRSVGESSDIVNKEMYTFLDKGNRSITLRPEFTAGVLRASVNAKLESKEDLPIKLCYVGPVFRYERPQLGRFRQFNQFGVEQIGTHHYYQDIETMLLGHEILKDVGFKDLKVVINNLGDDDMRAAYRTDLLEYFKNRIGHMCHDCQVRYETNPLRILDCKVEEDRKIISGAPDIASYWSDKEKEYMRNVTERLDAMGIKYEVNHNLVRGLDYYSHLVFEYYYDGPDGASFGAIGAGGHYDHLYEQLGGAKLPGIGFSLGVDRLIKVLMDNNLVPKFEEPLRLVFMPLGQAVYGHAFSILEEVRKELPFYLIESEILLTDKSLSSLFKVAERKKAHIAVIIGEDEVKNKKLIIKNLANKEQLEIADDDLVHFLQHQLGIADHEHHEEE